MSCRIPNGCCAFCVARLESSLVRRCSVGRLACARRTAFGRHTGTEKWQSRLGSKLIASDLRRYRSDYASSKRIAGNLTTSFSNTSCGKSQVWSRLSAAMDALLQPVLFRQIISDELHCGVEQVIGVFLLPEAVTFVLSQHVPDGRPLFLKRGDDLLRF